MTEQRPLYVAGDGSNGRKVEVGHSGGTRATDGAGPMDESASNISGDVSPSQKTNTKRKKPFAPPSVKPLENPAMLREAASLIRSEIASQAKAINSLDASLFAGPCILLVLDAHDVPAKFEFPDGTYLLARMFASDVVERGALTRIK